MAEVLLRVGGAVERLLEALVRKGYFKTKSEALRAGILELAKEYALVRGPSYARMLIGKEARGSRGDILDLAGILDIDAKGITSKKIDAELYG